MWRGEGQRGDQPSEETAGRQEKGGGERDSVEMYLQTDLPAGSR